MEAINRILVVLDPYSAPTNKAQPAMNTGITLAREMGAELHFGLVQYNNQLHGKSAAMAEARETFMQTWREWLADCISKLDTDGIAQVQAHLEWDHPWHDGILRQAMKLDADLVIKDIHHHPRWGKSMFTNTDWHLVRECPKALLMLKSGRWHNPPRILAAVDPMHERDKPAALDHRIVDHAKLLRDAIKGELSVFHAFQPAINRIPVEAGGIPLDLPIEQDAAAIENAHREALDALLANRECTADEVVLEVGPPADSLIARIEDHSIDLVVMGAIARGALKRLFLGSTAERVFGELSADLLVVKPADFQCPVDLH
ncbi:MAG: universal stress protein [Pseudomonadota bacterium]